MVSTSTTPATLLDRIAAYDGHLVYASRTGSGKTQLLLAALAHKTERTKGAIEWLCATGKASVWMGLEHQVGRDEQPRVLTASLSQPESIEPVLKRLRFAVRTQEEREKIRIERTQQGKPHKFKPIYIVLDEWLILLKVGKRHSSKARQELIDLAETIILKGRQDRVFLWLAAQGHHCQTLHIDGDLRSNLGVIALGGQGNYQSVTSAVTDPYLIEVASERRSLEADYQSLTAEEPDGRIFYTSIGGHQLGRTLQLPDMEQQQVFKADPVAVERKKLERTYERSPNVLPREVPTSQPSQESVFAAYLNQQERIIDKQLALQKQSLRVDAHRARTEQQRVEVEAFGSTVTAEDRWNLVTLVYGVVVFGVYLIPMFSGSLQNLWRLPGQLQQQQEHQEEQLAPSLSTPPKAGDKINGYEVKSVSGNTVEIVLKDGVLYPIGKEPVEVQCNGDRLSYLIGSITYTYSSLNNCAGGKQTIGQVIGRSKATVQVSRSDAPPTQADLWQALTGTVPEPALDRVQVTSKGQQIAEKAVAWVGKEFKPGEQAQCATFIRQVLRETGSSLGVTQKAVDGQSSGEALANSFFGEDMGQIIRDVNELQPGDLIAYGGTYGGYPASTITHVAVYVGNGEIVDRVTSDRAVS
ncbi:MAG TPA: NlpC/P60 family protein, partial [Thermosynechococcaceae cyanobacterium]